MPGLLCERGPVLRAARRLADIQCHGAVPQPTPALLFTRFHDREYGRMLHCLVSGILGLITRLRSTSNLHLKVSHQVPPTDTQESVSNYSVISVDLCPRFDTRQSTGLPEDLVSPQHGYVSHTTAIEVKPSSPSSPPSPSSQPSKSSWELPGCWSTTSESSPVSSNHGPSTKPWAAKPPRERFEDAVAVEIQSPITRNPGSEKERFVTIKPDTPRNTDKDVLLAKPIINPTTIGAIWHLKPLLYLDQHSKGRRVFLHFHGGAFVLGCCRDQEHHLRGVSTPSARSIGPLPAVPPKLLPGKQTSAAP